MKASVVIPTYNRRDDLGRVLDALERQTEPEFEVIVVDNSSVDGTDALVRARSAQSPYPLRYIRKEPEGPAAARNLGAQEAAADLLAFVDSDVELDPDWLAAVLQEMAGDPGLGAVGGQVIYANDPGFLNSYGGALSRIGLCWDRLEGEPVQRAEASADVAWINCSAVLVRRAALKAAGGFDGRFFYAFEDSDVGWRIALLGWTLRVIPQARALHHVGDEISPASGVIVFHACKNRLASLIANAGPGLMLGHLPLALGYAVADAILRAPRAPKWRALWWNAVNLRGTLRRRRSIQAARRLDDSDLPFTPRLFPETRLAGMRRRPNRAQTLRDAADDRV